MRRLGRKGYGSFCEGERFLPESTPRINTGACERCNDSLEANRRVDVLLHLLGLLVMARKVSHLLLGPLGIAFVHATFAGRTPIFTGNVFWDFHNFATTMRLRFCLFQPELFFQGVPWQKMFSASVSGLDHNKPKGSPNFRLSGELGSTASNLRFPASESDLPKDELVPLQESHITRSCAVM